MQKALIVPTMKKKKAFRVSQLLALYWIDIHCWNPTIPNPNNDIKNHPHQEQHHYHLLKNVVDKEMTLPRKHPSIASWENGNTQKWKLLIAAISCCTHTIVGAIWQQPVDGPYWHSWAVSSCLLWLWVIWPCLRNLMKTCQFWFHLNLPSTHWLLHFTTFPVSFAAVMLLLDYYFLPLHHCCIDG